MNRFYDFVMIYQLRHGSLRASLIQQNLSVLPRVCPVAKQI
jgi:hypothetical protein